MFVRHWMRVVLPRRPIPSATVHRIIHVAAGVRIEHCRLSSNLRRSRYAGSRSNTVSELDLANVHPSRSQPQRSKGCATKAIGEGDGILRSCFWLDRTPESFVVGMNWDAHRARLREPSNKRLRFDTQKIYAALDAQRRARQMSWGEVERQVGVSENSMKHLAKGGRTSFPMVIRIVQWLGEPTASFTRISDW